jgi:hypothetical protein
VPSCRLLVGPQVLPLAQHARHQARRFPAHLCSDGRGSASFLAAGRRCRCAPPQAVGTTPVSRCPVETVPVVGHDEGVSGGSVEHPFGNFKTVRHHLRRLGAPKNPHAFLESYLVNEDLPAKPRMPGIKDFPLFGPVGVMLSSCIMSPEPTGRWTKIASPAPSSADRKHSLPCVSWRTTSPLRQGLGFRYTQPPVKLSFRERVLLWKLRRRVLGHPPVWWKRLYGIVTTA